MKGHLSCTMLVEGCSALIQLHLKQYCAGERDKSIDKIMLSSLSNQSRNLGADVWLVKFLAGTDPTRHHRRKPFPFHSCFGGYQF